MAMKHTFSGLTVVSFESRRAREMERLIKRFGGLPFVAPSMREVALSMTPELEELAELLGRGEVDVVILLTGVGTTQMLRLLAERFGRECVRRMFDGPLLLARGPKPVAALKKWDLEPDVVVPEPNTWRDVLRVVDERLEIEGGTVALQEYGAANDELLRALQERGATVKRVHLYRWELPEDTRPLREAIRLIIEGSADVALFTSAQQARNLFEVAKAEGAELELRKGFARVLIGSVGPVTSEALRGLGLSVDYEPDSPKMGNLIMEVARRCKALLQRKRVAAAQGVDTASWRRIDMVWPESAASGHPEPEFVKACRRASTGYTPVWFMRQAGRFLREYRELRSKVSFLELCTTPELAAEVALMAVDRLGVDAAILFSDILLVLRSLGLDLEYTEGRGPVIHRPVRGGSDLGRLRGFLPETLDFVYEAVRLTRRALSPEVALIGFAGAPFTLASYAIEGGASRLYANTKRMMYGDPEGWERLMTLLVDATASYLQHQAEAGADALQIFDTWVGCLSPADYDRFVFPHMRRLFSMLEVDVPVIQFGTGACGLLVRMREAGGDVMGLDWRVDLAEAWRRLGYDVAVQGNLDPVVLLGSKREVTRQAKRILDAARGRPGHIFNLGHGVLPTTPVDNVLALVDFVHEYSERKGAGTD